jgi:CubicO group peptidase (beta-lactamase class C family)
MFARGNGPDGNPLTSKAELPMQSNTKSFTAAILLQAVADGLVTLDTPVGIPTRFPWFTAAKDVKLKDLLGHRSGLLNYADTAEYKADWTKIDSPGAALQAVQSAGLQFAPGSHVSYSSSNYIVAGLLAEQIYGTPIEQLITERILNRLGLSEMRVQAPSPGAPGTGTGNMYSTITDMARWTQAHWRDNRLLTPSAQRLATTFPKTSMLGYGTWGFCPCKKVKGTLAPAAIGSNGGESLLRYYAATDTVVVVYLPGGIWTDGRIEQAEALVTSLLAAAKP